MSITYHTDVVQGSDEWVAMRRGLITASEMNLILTPTLKGASFQEHQRRRPVTHMADCRLSQPTSKTCASRFTCLPAASAALT